MARAAFGDFALAFFRAGAAFGDLSLQFLWQAQHLVILLLQFSLLLPRGGPTENKTLRTPIQRSINSDQCV